MDITQNRLDILSQPIHNKLVKIEILDKDLKVLDTLETVLLDGSLSFDADNDYRRGGSLTLLIPQRFNSPMFTKNIEEFNLTIGAGAYIWLDRCLKIYIGIKNYKSVNLDDDIEWYNMGIYIIDNPSETFSATDNSISFNLLDLMTRYSNNRQGQMANLETLIPSDVYEGRYWIRTKFRTALVEFLTNICGIKNYLISNIPDEFENLPYDIEVKVGSTKLDIINKFRDIIPNWEYFFDENGVFVFQPIPSGEGDMTLTLDNEKVKSENISVEFSNVKNQIIIYGVQHSCVYFANSCNYVSYISGGVMRQYLDLYFDTFAFNNINKSSVIGFTTPPSYTNEYPIDTVRIHATAGSSYQYTIVPYANKGSTQGSFNPIPASTFEPNTSYVINVFEGNFDQNGNVINEDIEAFQLYSHYQARSCSVDNNPSSPYYINRGIKGKNYYAGKNANGLNSTSNIYLVLNDYDVDGEYLNTLEDGTIITFVSTISDLASNTQINVHVYNQDHDLLITNIFTHLDGTWNMSGVFANDYTIWQIRYNENDDRFELLGRLFDATTLVLTDGVYSVIPCDDLAKVRSDYELYLHSNLNDSITLNIFPNYLLEVNTKISYNNYFGVGADYSEFITSSNDNFITSNDRQFMVVDTNNEANKYLIKRIELNLSSLDGGQTITAMKIQPSLGIIPDEPQLDAPVISRGEEVDKINISEVTNANSYKIYINGSFTKEVSE